MRRIEIDPNVRVRGNQTYAGFEDADGIVAKGDQVEVHEGESGLTGRACVNDVDDTRRLIYLIVDWPTLKTGNQA